MNSYQQQHIIPDDEETQQLQQPPHGHHDVAAESHHSYSNVFTFRRSEHLPQLTQFAIVAVALIMLITVFIMDNQAVQQEQQQSIAVTPIDLPQHTSAPREHNHNSNSPKGKHGPSSPSEPSTSSPSSSSSSPSPSPSPPSPSLSPSYPFTSPLAPSSPLISEDACSGPWPGYPFCADHMSWMQKNWNANPQQEAYYRSQNVDGTKCSFLNYLNQHGFYCPEAVDATKEKIRGVNIGGWLVIEPWIAPSLFEQFDKKDMVQDQWTFCQKLGKAECRNQLQKHWDTWLDESDLRVLSQSGINHVRIPIGYWLFGDIRSDEPWVDGELYYLNRALKWCQTYKLNVVLDLHCAPGSQNGFDNSGRKGDIHFADTVKLPNGRTYYPNVERSLAFISNLTRYMAENEFLSTVVGIELVNEAFVTIPIQIVKDYYIRGYELVKQYGDIAVIIGDSFRFGEWNDFMFPPHYRHVWIDTHIYQVFDLYRLSFTWAQHIQQTCTLNKPEVAVAPLSTMVGEWSLATTDCAQWLNGYNTGSRFDGTLTGVTSSPPLGSCIGQHDIHNRTIWTPDYRQFLRDYSDAQMDAYESGSSEGWFFWNFKTERAPQWNYMLAIKEGWVRTLPENRTFKCK